MALSASEHKRGGFVRDDDDALVVTEDATGASFDVIPGFLRDPDGRLVVTTDLTGARPRAGFLRAPNGALVIVSA